MQNTQIFCARYVVKHKKNKLLDKHTLSYYC